MLKLQTATTAKPSTLRREIIILGGFALMALLFTFPLIVRFMVAVPGEDNKDAWQMVWNLWWVRHALETGQSPFQTDLLFYPIQPRLVLHALNAWNGFVSLPVQYLFDWLGGAAHGAVAAYNFIVLLSFTLGAYGAYRLALWLWGDWKAALAAGVAYGFSAFNFDHLLGHLNLISTEFIPFYILFLLKTLTEQEKWVRNASLTTLLLIFNTFLDLQFVLYLGIFSVLLMLYLTVKHMWKRDFSALMPLFLRAGAIALAFVLLTLPFTIPLMQDIASNPNAVPKREENIYSADLLAYLYPSPFQPLWGNAMKVAVKPWTATLIEKIVFPGYTVYLLGLFGLVVTVLPILRKKLQSKPVVSNRLVKVGAEFWLVVAGLFALLSFGRRLHINGIEVGPPLPASLIFDMPILNVTRVPSRYALPALLALGLLAAWGLSKLLALEIGWNKRKIGQASLAGLFCLTLAFELFPAPYQMTEYNVPQFYRELAKDPSKYAILDLPVSQYETSYMEAQMEHGKPLLGGYVSRNPAYFILDGAPIFREFRNFETAPKPDILPAQPLSLDTLRYFNARYVIIHEDRVQSRSQLDKLLTLAYRLFPQGPVYAKEGLQVFETPAGVPENVFFYYPLLSSWNEAENDPSGMVYRWAKESEAKMEFWCGQPRRLELEFPAWSFHEAHSLELYLNGVKLPDGSRSIGLEPQNVRVTLDLQAGRNILSLKIGGNANRPSDFAPGPDTRSLTIAVGTAHFLNP
ncbi:hypothetical protein [Candidatus Chlorohelix sp.]|uniref:hypothetical protein n=1 Tax=Candidatus Chlorohelix sp. TaxID=3139201 RepID=UPI003050AFBA